MAGENINRRINIYVNDKEVVNSSRGIGRAMKQVSNEMKNLNRDAEDYDEQMRRLVDTYAELERRQAQFRNDMAGTRSVLDRVKDALGPVATGMLAAFSIQEVISGFVSSFSEAMDIIVEFDQKQADLAAIMGKSRVGISALTADAIKYGATTSYNATQVTELQTELARLGNSEKDIRSMTAAILEGATALEADLGSAAEFIGGQLNSYGAEASKAQEFTDILANSANYSASSFESLGTALPKVSKVAALTDIPFTKLNATLGVLADESIAAETAGTGFRNILLTSAQAGKPYEEMLKKVARASDKTKMATELFGKENATVAVILATSTEKINANTKALENSAGAAQKLAKEKLNSIKGSVESFSGAWEGFILSLEKGDGPIAKTIIKIINLGTSILNLITPTKQLSDEIRGEQIELNKLVGKITSSNIGNDERKRLLIQLKDEYPDFIKNIDTETVSNDQLYTALGKVNGEYAKRIVLQREQEKIDKISVKQADSQEKYLKYYDELYDKIVTANVDRKLNVKIDEGDLLGSAQKVYDKLIKAGVSRMSTEAGSISALRQNIMAMEEEVARYGNQIDKANKKLDSHAKAMGVVKESERELVKLREQAFETGMKNAMKAPEAEVRAWVDAYNQLQNLRKEATEQGLENADKYNAEQLKKWLLDKARREAVDEKELEKEAKKIKKRNDDWLKDDAELEKKLRDTRQQAEDAKLATLQEGYDKERQVINAEYQHKTEDLQAQIVKEAELEKLRAGLATAQKSGDTVAIAHYKKELATKLELNKLYSEKIEALERTRMLKIAGLQEKYLLKELERKEAAQQVDVNRLKIAQNNELAGFDSLAHAKAILSDYLSNEELRKVTTLEQAKLRIKEVHAKQEYELQEQQLLDMMALWQGMLNQETEAGTPFFSEAQRTEINKFLDEAALKLSEIRAGKTEVATASKTKEKADLTGIDLLGLNANEWEKIFTNIDTFSGKLQAVVAVAGAMKNAFSMYFDYLNAAEDRSIQKFERSTNRKKKALDVQLDRGYITQDVYNARVAKLDAELDKKKALLEYKQAKRQRAINIANIMMNTAQAIMSIWAQVPKFDFGISAGILSGFVGALGAAQLATVLATPLPSPEGFKTGGYTGDGNMNDIAGPVHKREYVIPENVLFDKDPAIPRIINYVEAKRLNKAGYKKGGATSEMPTDNIDNTVVAKVENTLMYNLLLRTTNVLEKLESNGVDGYVVIDMPAAKKIKKQLRDLEALQNSAKG